MLDVHGASGSKGQKVEESKSESLRARAIITSHFGISSSSHFWQILKSKNLEIVHYYSAFRFLKSTKPKLNLGAKNVNLFLREPLGLAQDFIITINQERREEMRGSVF